MPVPFQLGLYPEAAAETNMNKISPAFIIPRRQRLLRPAVRAFADTAAIFYFKVSPAHFAFEGNHGFLPVIVY